MKKLQKLEIFYNPDFMHNVSRGTFMHNVSRGTFYHNVSRGTFSYF